jgi:NTE family protein
MHNGSTTKTSLRYSRKIGQHCLFVLLFLNFFMVLQAQDTLVQPKIGVVLSGGGAKGLAHIGVLKVLEETGIKVDYIAGTSMGAIIGGLYASGYSAHQLDSIFQVADYDAIVRDFVPRSAKSFYEKDNDEKYALTLPFKNMRLGIPVALSRGMYNYNLITRLTYHVRNVRDFKELPIPFFCIATDIETGEEILLDKGFLPRAVLASGAFPTLYTPVEIDGRYLVDGGVVNNYPVAELKKRGADIIIGVDVQDDLKSRDELRDATRILVQISNLQMTHKMQQSRALTDIYIKPDINDFSVISFDQGQRIIQRGEQAATLLKDSIQRWSTGHKKEPLKTLTEMTDTISVGEIQTPVLKNYTRSYLIGKLRFKPKMDITFEDLIRGTENLNTSMDFSSIQYSFQTKDDERDDLTLYVTENPQKQYLKFGVHYDELFKTGLLLNYTRKKAFFKNDVFSLDLILGDNFRYNFDYYIDNGFYWSFGVKSNFNQFNRNVGTNFRNSNLLFSTGSNSINIDFSDLTNQIYVQTFFVQKFLMGGGLELKHLKIKSETLDNDPPVFEDSDYLSVYGYIRYDSFDNRYFPKSGWFFSGEAKSFLYSSDFSNLFTRFSIFKAEWAYAKTFNDQLTLKLQSEGGFTLGDQTVPFFNFILGGYGFNMINNFRHFYGYKFLTLTGDSYVKGAVTLDWEFFRKNHFNFTANYANIGQNIFERNQWLTRPTFSGYAFGYGLETLAGPIEIKHSWSPETSQHYTWISVGYWF